MKTEQYKNFDISSIEEFKSILQGQTQLAGLNVTIPYKEAVIPFLNKLDPRAREIGAVNTIKILPDGELLGFNTDVYGFEKSIQNLLKESSQKSADIGHRRSFQGCSLCAEQVEY